MNPSVVDHYTSGPDGSSAGLRDRIAAAIDALELGNQPLTIDHLAGVSEFHVGGRAATLDVIEHLGLSSSSHVLDLGSGLGGTARLIASRTGARVTGIDLTPEFVDVATWLTRLVGLESHAEFHVGSAVDATGIAAAIDHRPIDAITLLHVGMNIADKSALARAAVSALRPGGRFVIYDILAGGAGGDVNFPVPWAGDPSMSHLSASSSYVEALEAAGLAVDLVEDRTAWAIEALSQAPPPTALHLGLVLGSDARSKVQNLRVGIERGDLAPTLLVSSLRQSTS
ncbi:MAG: class I SAM-dependent methyltransferase [Actinomycetota bacterium]